MIRQRFNPGRLSRIGAWALAAVTAMAAMLNNQIAAADEKADVPPDEPTVDRFAATRAAVPAAPSEGLLVLRFQPTPAPPPPTIVRRVIVEERVAGATGSTTAPTARRAASAPSSAAPAASPAPPPPAPARLAAPPPVQSSGS